jgi:undecaprenyl-diphosphatase
MIEQLISLDTELFFLINGFHTPFLDLIMHWLSDRYIWIPMYLFVIFTIYKSNNKNWWAILLVIIISVGFADFFTSGLMKPFFERLRPCHVAFLSEKIHLNGNCGGKYGFASSHAANSFALATSYFLFFGKKNQNLSIFLFIWAILVSFSRIYNGVHYPLDITVGAFIGSFISYILSIRWTSVN